MSKMAKINIILKAKQFAFKKHDEQFCTDKLPYVMHPIAVATMLSQLTSNKNVIVAGMLHDTLEDTKTTVEEIRNEFISEIDDSNFELIMEKKNLLGYEK